MAETEKEEIPAVAGIFRNAFREMRQRRLVIYGIGENTRTIVENTRDFHFVGLMDGVRKQGELFGIKIVKDEELVCSFADAVVIVARASSTGIILRRIAGRCLAEGIGVYDIAGTDLLHPEKPPFETVRWPRREELYQMLSRADTVSFDIFDTLLCRKTLYPTDHFELMRLYRKELPEDFAGVRISVEREHAAGKNPTIREIYEEIGRRCRWDGEYTEQILRLEAAVDGKCIIPRREMVEAYEHCLKTHKKVYLLSDMYYTKEMLAGLLRKNGITGYEDIFVSCEYQTSKSERLFDEYIHSAGEGKKLHIGDDPEADIFPAEKRNIECFRVMKAEEMLEKSRYAEALLQAETLDDRLAAGLMASEIFNSPFGVRKGRGSVESARSFGFCFIGPVVYKFCTWLIHKALEEQTDRILFSARDGYMVKAVYELLCQKGRQKEALPAAAYLYASRAAFVKAAILDEKDIAFAGRLAFDGSPQEMLAERFGLSPDEILPPDGDGCNTECNTECSTECNTGCNTECSTGYNAGCGSDLDYLLLHKSKILEKSACCRDRVRRYLKASRIRITDKTAFFDFVSSGTCHKCIQKITGREIKGYYFSFIGGKHAAQELKAEELFKSVNGCVSDYFLCNHYLFLENIFTSPEPSVQEFDPQGNPVFAKETRTGEQIEELEEIHAGIQSFAEQMLCLANGERMDQVSAKLTDSILKFVLTRYTDYRIPLKCRETLTDEFCRRTLSVKEILGEPEFEGVENG